VIVDGHNDLVLRTWRGDPCGHMDLDAARDAGYAGGFFAIYVPSPHPPDPTETPYAPPLAEPIPIAWRRVAAELYERPRALPIAIATSADDFTPDRVTAIVTEEPIRSRPTSRFEDWYVRGLRSVGLVRRGRTRRDRRCSRSRVTGHRPGLTVAAGSSKLQPARHPGRPRTRRGRLLDVAGLLRRRSSRRTERARPCASSRNSD
jgi:hypothetical protein